MTQPARHLHIVEPLTEPLMRTMRRFGARIGLTGVVLVLVCCISVWMAVMVRLLAWIFNA